MISEWAGKKVPMQDDAIAETECPLMPGKFKETAAEGNHFLLFSPIFWSLQSRLSVLYLQ